MIYVWIGLFEGANEDGWAEGAVFLLLTKVRRFETITAGKHHWHSILLFYPLCTCEWIYCGVVLRQWVFFSLDSPVLLAEESWPKQNGRPVNLKLKGVFAINEMRDEVWLLWCAQNKNKKTKENWFKEGKTHFWRTGFSPSFSEIDFRITVKAVESIFLSLTCYRIDFPMFVYAIESIFHIVG